ncbi:MAG: arabinan endo-1,5-alpha-L-arabinosidase [Planctomycetaceae bacterium]|nr:arabinan endo-1,5-alpha-L-arabinosidase [Planctomycetaceae bacterium]
MSAQLPAEEEYDATSLEALRSGMPDPAIVEAKDGSGFYVYTTGHGVKVFHSEDLKSWKLIGRVFDRHVPQWAEDAVPGCDGIWAPDIQFFNGQYHLYYSVSTFGSQRSVIGLATSRSVNPDSKDYKWIDRGLVVESFAEKNDFNAIDPAVFADKNGKAYLYWGSYWTGIKGVEINPGTGKPFEGNFEYKALAQRTGMKFPTNIEAPFVVQQGQYYYLMASWDFCCAGKDSTYKVVVGRSQNALGPFVDRQGRSMNEGGGEVILASDVRWRGPGHNSFLQTAGGDYLVHHVYDNERVRNGRILQIRGVEWTKDGWFKVGNPLLDPLAQQRNKKKLSPLVGAWTHVVNQKDTYHIFLEVSGEISGTAGESYWQLEGRKLVLKWLDPQAPDGAWIDEVTLSSNGKKYYGKNQNGAVIEGAKRFPKE